MIIEQGLRVITVLEIKSQDNAGLKWEYLKPVIFGIDERTKSLICN